MAERTFTKKKVVSFSTLFFMCTLTWITEKKLVLHVQICLLLIRRKSVLRVQFVFLLIRSITLEAIFIVVPRLALHDLIFFVYTYY